MSIITFNSSANCILSPKNIHEITPYDYKFEAFGTTKLVDGLFEGKKVIDNWILNQSAKGNTYFIPCMLLFTDGEPDADQDLIQAKKPLKLIHQLNDTIFVLLV
jgi:uncharacterized protein YegL